MLEDRALDLECIHLGKNLPCVGHQCFGTGYSPGLAWETESLASTTSTVFSKPIQIGVKLK